MQRREKKEVPISACDVSPGYLYDGKYHPRDDGVHVALRTCPVRFKVTHINSSVLQTLIQNSSGVGSQWMQDYQRENPEYAILLKGSKISEITGCRIPSHNLMGTVSSVLYKGYTDMLITFSKSLDDPWIKKLENYLLAVLDETPGIPIPGYVLKLSKTAFIYSGFDQTKGISVQPSKHAFQEFCNTLKNTKISTAPIAAYINEPDSADLRTVITALENPVSNTNVAEYGQSGDKKNSTERKQQEELDKLKEWAAEKLSSINNVERPSFVDLNIIGRKSLQGSNPNNQIEATDVHNKEMSKITSKQTAFREKVEEPGVVELNVVGGRHLQGSSSNSQMEFADVHKDISKSTGKQSAFQEKVESISNQYFVERTSNEVTIDLKVDESNSKNDSESQSECNTRQKETKVATQKTLEHPDDTNINILKPQSTDHMGSYQKSTLLNPVKIVNEPFGVKRMYYGVVNDTCPEKVILFLGASGSGKTMLVNFIANYFIGNKSADDKLVHVVTPSPTTGIAAYTFYSDKDSISFSIIDTPGLNDSSGAEVRDHVQSLKMFIANASSKGFEIHAIGFVAQAHLVRLTSSERLVMDYVSTTFGRSVSDHLITLITFADNQETPQVVEAMKNYGVNFKLFLKFNNSALSITNTDEIDDLDKAYWRVGWKNWKKCLKTLRDLPSLSCNTMKAVQNEIYATTVTKSAERDLRGELTTFFTYCKKESSLSREASQVCEQVWELATVIHRMRSLQGSEPKSLGSILISYGVEACKTLHIDPDRFIYFLSLAPSRNLMTSGSEVILTLSPFYTLAKGKYRNSEALSKSIIEWSYCHKCDKEHKMTRCKNNGSKWYNSGASTDILSLKCEECNCPAELHGMSFGESPFHPKKVLQHALKCLSEVVKRHSLPSYPVKEEYLLKYIDQHLNFMHRDFISDLLSERKR